MQGRQRNPSTSHPKVLEAQPAGESVNGREKAFPASAGQDGALGLAEF